MRGTVKTLLWVWIILDSVASSVTLPEITDGKFIEDCVKEHNKARSSVIPPARDMRYMTWDEGLAITARAWAKHCMFKHNIYLKEANRMHPTLPSVGENIWTGFPPSSFNVKSAMEKWVNEKDNYDYSWNTCKGVCGHYTQVVWASSYKVGCAVELCPNGVQYFKNREGVIFVCNYATAGNIQGMRPYQSEGAACSGCAPDDICENNFCHSKVRDSLKSYNWTPDWDTTAQTTSLPAHLNFVTILIIRPVAIFFTFITAYAVHYKYPNVFCYE